MGKRRTPEEFKKEFNEKANGQYILLSDFTRTDKKVKVRHEECGREYEVEARSFLRGSRCARCASPLKKTQEQFIKEIEEKTNGKYMVVGKYINRETKVEIKCTTCNEPKIIIPDNFLIKQTKCKKCTEIERTKKKQEKLERIKEKIKQKYSISDIRKVFVESLGDNYLTQGIFSDFSSEVIFKHKTCGHEWKTTPLNFIKFKSKCPECRKSKYSKKTNEQFLKEVESQVGNEYTFLETYKTSNSYLKVVHNKCGFRYKVKPYNFLGQKNRCPKCAGVMKKTTKQFKQEMFEKYGKEYEVLGEYTKAREKILIKHNKCGYEWEVTPDQILRRKTCPQCSGRRVFRGTYKERVALLTKDEYEVLGEYKGAAQKILMKHNECGRTFEMRPNHFINGARCPKCAGRCRTTESFKQEVYDLVGNEYEVLGEYINYQKKIKMKHNVCGYEYEVLHNSFLQGSRCPKCASSKGEKRIEEYLREKHIIFDTQHRIETCKDKLPLPFDFVIFDVKYNLKILIEYDGKQHYEVVEHWGGEEAFKDRCNKDRIKTQYCKENNIPLIRIPYWEFDNIEVILEKELAALGVIKEELIEPVLT